MAREKPILESGPEGTMLSRARTEPSDEVVGFIEERMTFTTWRKRRRWIALSVAVVMATLGGIALEGARRARVADKLAKSAGDLASKQKTAAQKATAEKQIAEILAKNQTVKADAGELARAAVSSTEPSTALELAIRAAELEPGAAQANAVAVALGGVLKNLGGTIPAVSESGQWAAIAGCCGDGVARNLKTGRQIHLCGDPHPIDGLWLSPDGLWLVASRNLVGNSPLGAGGLPLPWPGPPARLEIWDLVRSRRVAAVDNQNAANIGSGIWVTFPPHAKSFIAAPLVSGPSAMYSLRDGSVLANLNAEARQTYAISPDGRSFFAYQAEVAGNTLRRSGVGSRESASGRWMTTISSNGRITRRMANG